MRPHVITLTEGPIQPRQMLNRCQILCLQIFYEIKCKTFLSQKHSPSDNVALVEEELDGIGNLVDFPRLVFIIYEECGNLKLVIDGGEFTRKKKTFYKPIQEVLQNVHSVQILQARLS